MWQRCLSNKGARSVPFLECLLGRFVRRFGGCRAREAGGWQSGWSAVSMRVHRAPTSAASWPPHPRGPALWLCV